MKELAIKARFYIFAALVTGAMQLAIHLYQLDFAHHWLSAVILSALASLALLFKVEGATNRTHYNIAFVVFGAALALHGASLAAIVILISHCVEWVWHRYPWYIQAFNIAMYITVANGAGIVYAWINSSGGMQVWQSAPALLMMMAVFTLLNHVMVGLIVSFARGESFLQSGVLEFFSLVMDFTMLCMGAVAAIVWVFNPAAILLVLLPLYLIYTTLRVPALERQTEIDPKTNVFNHRHFESSLESEVRRAERFDHPLSIVMADLDFLRNINNTYGHLAGDEVLIGIARILKDAARDYEVVARFGGEEFAMLMLETTPEQAFLRVEVIRKAIEVHEFLVPTSVTPIKATMSFGIAGLKPGALGRDIVQNADTALYHAKLKGRNQTFIYSDEGFEYLFAPADTPHPPLRAS